MAPIIWADVTSIAPELTNKIPDAAQLAFLAIANGMLVVSDWGGELDPTLKLARCYIAAHHATLGRRRGIGGAITSEGADGLNRAYQAAQSTSQYNSTSYGQLYLLLAKTKPFRAGLLPGQWNGGGTGWV